MCGGLVRWLMVDVKLVRKLKEIVSLEEMKAHRDGPLKDMVLLQRGTR